VVRRHPVVPEALQRAVKSDARRAGIARPLQPGDHDDLHTRRLGAWHRWSEKPGRPVNSIGFRRNGWKSRRALSSCAEAPLGMRGNKGGTEVVPPAAHMIRSLLEHDFPVLLIHKDRVPRFELPVEDLEAERVDGFVLDGTLQRAGTIGGVAAFLGSRGIGSYLFSSSIFCGYTH
jgi:hypothetical protein